MELMKQIVIKTINWITLIILLPLAVCSLFFHRGVDFATFKEATLLKGASPFLDVFSILLILFCFYCLFRLFYSEDKAIWAGRIGIVIMTIIAGAIAIWWVSVNPFQPVADQEKTWTAAAALAKGIDLDAELVSYFDTCPAQKVMAEIMSLIIRLFGIDPICFRYINVICVVLTMVGIVLCIKRLTTDINVILTTEILLTLFVPLALYAAFVYGQIPATFFCVISVYGMIRYFEKGRVIWLALPVICMPAAIISYQATMICFIAVAIVMIVKTTEIEKKGKWIACIISLIAICLISATLNYGLKKSFDNSLGTVENPGKGIPALAYISMGLNQSDEDAMPGAFDASHREMYLTCGRDSRKASKMAIDSVKQSISDFISGNRSLSFFKEKTEYQWLDPWFGGVTMTVYGNESGDEKFDRLIAGDLLPVIERVLFALMLFVYFGALICQIWRIRYGCNNILVCFPNLYFIGGFVFQLFWEQKSRYCLPYYLALFPLAARGIYVLFSASGMKNRADVRRTVLWKRVYIFAAICITFVIAGFYYKDKAFDFPADVIVGDDGSCSSQELSLYPGDYHIKLQYISNKDTEIALYLTESGEGTPAVLSEGSDEFEFDLHLDEYTDVMRFRYMIESTDDFVLKNIHIECDRALYTDHIFIALGFLAAVFYIMYLISSVFLSDRQLREKIWIAGIHLAVILVSIPLFSADLFWGADAPAHLMRLDGTRDALLGRELPAFIFPRNDEGYGLLGFMYPGLFLYIPALLRVFRASVPLVFNLIYISINIATAAAAYISSKPLFERKEIRYLYTLLYIMMPYRLVNIYTRADLGESLAMIFIPLVIAGFYICISGEKESCSKRAICFLTIGMTGIINSHVLSSVMITVFLVIYFLIFIRYSVEKQSIRILAVSAISIFLINLWYIIPFVRLYLFGLNTSYLTDRSFTGRFSLIRLLGIHDFSDGTAWGGIAISGVIGILIYLLSVVLPKKTNRDRRHYFMLVSCAAAVLLFITVAEGFPWESLEKFSAVRSITGIMQFSFRVMTVASPLIVMVTAYGAERYSDRSKIYHVVLGLIAVSAIITVIPGIFGELKAEPYMNRLTGGASEVRLREYWPEGVNDGVFNEDRVYWSSENLQYDAYEKRGNRVRFEYYTMEDTDEWLEPPVMYYPGYTAAAVYKSGERKRLNVSQGDYFRVKIELPPAPSGASVKMRYGGIWYFYIGYIISFISMVLFVLYMLKDAGFARNYTGRTK